MNTILGRKLRMDQIFSDQGVVTPITWVFVEDEASFSVGDLLKIVGTTKGRGFQGVVKRHGFHGGPGSHGQKNRLRAPGSLGPTAPQRVIPGRKMGGRMGNDKQTLKAIKVIEWDADKKMLALKGSLPGRHGSKVRIISA